jgi:hypothetical protein
MSIDGPIVDEVRQRRCELSERFGHDLRAYFDHLREYQLKYRDRIVDQITIVQSSSTGEKHKAAH